MLKAIKHFKLRKEKKQSNSHLDKVLIVKHKQLCFVKKKLIENIYLLQIFNNVYYHIYTLLILSEYQEKTLVNFIEN